MSESRFGEVGQRGHRWHQDEGQRQHPPISGLPKDKRTRATLAIRSGTITEPSEANRSRRRSTFWRQPTSRSVARRLSECAKALAAPPAGQDGTRARGKRAVASRWRPSPAQSRSPQQSGANRPTAKGSQAAREGEKAAPTSQKERRCTGPSV